MSNPRRLRFALPDAATLRRLLAGPPPLRLAAAGVTERFFRDLYYDTPDRALRTRGVTCRFRIDAEDRRWLLVAVGGESGTRRPEAAGKWPDATAAFAGTSAPARRLQGIVNPERIEIRLEMEVHRLTRLVRRRLVPVPEITLVGDAVTVRSGEVSHVFHELTVERHHPLAPSLDRFAEALRLEFGARPLLADRLERAERVLELAEAEKLAAVVTRDREIALIVVDEGRVALLKGEGGFRLPVRTGRGEEACRELLRDVFGSPEGRLVQLGSLLATATRPAMDVWVARRVHRAPDPAVPLEWFEPPEVVARAGSPVLRDPRTLAALTLAGRSDRLPEWASAATPAGSDARASAEVRAQRRSFAQLAAAPLPGGARKATQGSPDQFFNIHLSLLEFNARVLALAEDPGTPLLARLRFLAILSANMDEFFMIRVGGLKRALALGKSKRSLDGLTPEEQLNAIGIRVQALVDRQRRCFQTLHQRDLPREKIAIRRWEELSPAEQAELRDYFEVEVLPLLTPKAITLAPGHPFPKIESRSLNLAVLVRDPGAGSVHYVSVTLPDHLPQLVRVGDTGTFVALEEIAAANIGELHPGRVVEAAYPFRLTRLGDLELDESATADLAQAIQEEVNRRGRAPVVRIELDRRMPPAIRQRLEQEIRSEEAGDRGLLGDADVYELDGLLNLGALADVSDSGIVPELDYPPFLPADPFEGSRSVLETLDERDVLVHHPYDSFEASFERFLAEAADDPHVAAIKLTLYRPGRPSAIGEAIHRAAAAGKDVTVFVELKARFDEPMNLVWARQLERAGIHVVTGLVRYKTHAKIALVVRRHGGRLRRYAHIGTGNYNRRTAKVYTDLGLFTADDGIGADLQALFNELTGSSRPPQVEFRRLLVAPTNMLSRTLGLIEREIAHAEAGRPARIRMKMNALVDAEVIAALYRASQAGVEMDMVVRGICALRPGVPGLSERIRVSSILGRFLEHARIYCFENGGEREYYIGSADLRPRNLRHRVEVVTPVTDAAGRERLEEILTTEVDDPTAWILNSDGSYTRPALPTGVEPVGAQEQLLAARARSADRMETPEPGSAAPGGR